MKVREAYLVAFITTVLTPASVPQSTNKQPTSGEQKQNTDFLDRFDTPTNF